MKKSGYTKDIMGYCSNGSKKKTGTKAMPSGSRGKSSSKMPRKSSY